MKLRNLHIENYKMFKNFDISFVDENDETLPIVVLAGLNGSGKTTVLEVIKNFIASSVYINTSLRMEIVTVDGLYQEFIPLQDFSNKDLYDEQEKLYGSHIEYFLSGLESMEEVSKEFVKTFYDFLKNHDYRPSEVKEHFHKYMMDVFDGIELTFKYSHLDKEDNVWFTNSEGQEFQIDKLSTGEKTLLSKILYIYFKDYRDKVILIDEPELSLHPKWQSQILSVYEKLADKNNCQIIIATHSPHIIGSAKAEYIRLLKKEDNKIVAIDNIDRSYGLEFDKILTDIMGVENLRTPDVAKDIKRLWDLLSDDDYESKEYKALYLKLEDMLGDLDKDMVLSRLEIARIKSRNAKA